MKSELEEFIGNNLEAFDNRVPDPAILERIQQQMRVGKKKDKVILVSMRTVLRIAACFILVAGAVTFWLLQKEPATKTITTAGINKTAPSAPATEPLVKDQPVKKDPVEQPRYNRQDAIDQELASNKQVLFAKLNDMGSPSQRMRAATQAIEMKNTDKEIVDALVNTMNTDPNTNVRLAALDALAKFHREPYVKKQLVAAMSKQKDPMVQIGLIELLTRMKQTTILKELDKMVNDVNTMDAVKDHAYSSIFILGS
ncbi:MAG: HEAT repeat domain-containing protein [Bacteroidota bacterium]